MKKLLALVLAAMLAVSMMAVVAQAAVEAPPAFHFSVDFIDDMGSALSGFSAQEYKVWTGHTFNEDTVFKGWCATPGGVKGYQYSFDGKEWKDVTDLTISDATPQIGAVVGHKDGHTTAGYKFTVPGTADATTVYLRVVTAADKTVVFAALTKESSADAAPQPGSDDYKNLPVDVEKETTAFRFSIDHIDDMSAGAAISGFGADKYKVRTDCTFSDDTVLEGWCATSEGIKGYQYSFDGKTWNNVEKLTVKSRTDLAGAKIPYEEGHPTAGFMFTIPGTKDVETIYVRAFTGADEVAVFAALTTASSEDAAPKPTIGTGDSGDNGNGDSGNGDTTNPGTADNAMVVFMIAGAAVVASLLLKKRAF